MIRIFTKNGALERRVWFGSTYIIGPHLNTQPQPTENDPRTSETKGGTGGNLAERDGGEAP